MPANAASGCGADADSSNDGRSAPCPDATGGRRRQAHGNHIDRQHMIDQAGVDHAAGHAVELGLVGVLHQYQTARFVDRDRAERTVRSGTRQDHSDRVAAVLAGQRLQEDIDRQHQTAGALGGQAQPTALKTHDGTRRNQVDLVGSDRHVVLDLDHRHAGMTGKQALHHALVVGRQVLDDDEGSAEFGRQAGEQLFERFETSRRGTDDDHAQGLDRRQARAGQLRRIMSPC